MKSDRPFESDEKFIAEDSMERRAGQRISGWAQARVKHDSGETIGVVLNMSDTGLYLETDYLPEEGHLLEVTLHLPDAVDPIFETEVAWVSKIGNHIPGLNYRVGLRIVQTKAKADLDFEALIRVFSEGSFEQTRLARIEVVAEGRPALRTPKPRALFFGGCYLIARDTLPEIGEELTLRFFVPTSSDFVRYKSQVVYLIDNDTARSLGVDQGFGVKFLEEIEGSSQSIVAYLGKNEPVFDGD